MHLCLVISFGFHTSDQSPTVNDRSQRLNITLNEIRPENKHSSQQYHIPQKTIASKNGKRAKNKALPAPPSNPNTPEPGLVKDEEPLAKSLSYAEVFRMSQEHIITSKTRDLKGSGDKSASSFDVPEEVDPYGKGSKNHSKIYLFAKELKERLSIPRSLLKLNQSGKASARFSRRSLKKNLWSPTRVVGDPYTRAILYEALKSIASDYRGREVISNSEYKNIEVDLSYYVLPDLSQNNQPFQMDIYNNRISYKYEFKSLSSAWDLVGAQRSQDRQGVSGSLNLIGIAKFFLNKKPRPDIELLRLKQSPAYAKPIR